MYEFIRQLEKPSNLPLLAKVHFEFLLSLSNFFEKIYKSKYIKSNFNHGC